jgi:hypothetical protein
VRAGRRGYGAGMDADESQHPGEAYPLEDTLEKLRDVPAGTRDPNIIGDAGATDVPPGSDPPEWDEVEEGPEP